MKDPEIEPFETELARLRPAAPPKALVSRLNAAAPVPLVPTAAIPGKRPDRARFTGFWGCPLRWLAPATLLVMAAGLAMLGRLERPSPPGPGTTTAFSRQPGAEDIVIDHRVVAAYDAVALLPGGQPVRFHCREWVDQIVFRDAARGLEIERSTPRLEVRPVRFETD